MCGIVGYVGQGRAQDLIYKGLSRLEYRGYDSAGIAAFQDLGGGKVATKLIKAPGKLKELKAIWKDIDFPSGQAIGHTRWATHGEANQVNAHPQDEHGLRFGGVKRQRGRQKRERGFHGVLGRMMKTAKQSDEAKFPISKRSRATC